MELSIVELLAALFWGALSIASPCVLPLLPGVMAYSTEKNRLTPVAIVLGLIISLVVMGLILYVFTSIFIDYIYYIRFMFGAIIILMGMYMLSETVENILLRAWQHVPLSRVSAARAEDGGLAGGVILGASLGIVWMPCIGPYLGAIYMFIAQDGNLFAGSTLLVTYCMGFALPMLAIAYSSNMLSTKVRALSKYTRALRKFGGVILLALGLYFIWDILGYLI